MPFFRLHGPWLPEACLLYTLPALHIHVYTTAVINQKRWFISPILSPEADKALGKYDPILRQLLYNRGIFTEDSARAFLEADTLFNYSPFQLIGMPEAVDRILFALNNHEFVAVYGDYDVDGVTATALLVQTLTALGVQAEGYIPNRFDEGYGLNNEALQNLQNKQVKLVITVDSGIRSLDEAAFARQIGLDMIITDHHQPAELLPQAIALINPKQPGDPYPDKDLAGVGVAYKLAQALLEKLAQTDITVNFKLESMLDLVALGTVADLAPLVGENRILVRNGLRCIRSKSRQGLLALAGVSDLDLAKTTAVNIGFVLGPRLNAAGRLESALAAFDLLTTPDPQVAGKLAQDLEIHNRNRQVITRTTQAQAEEIALKDDPEGYILFAVHPDFNTGVVGLAASRLVETHYRPAIVGQRNEETGFTRCSCRSIPEFHITEALDQCASLLVRHGGHAAAAGFTVKNENLSELQERLRQIAREKLSAIDLRPTLSADMEIKLAGMKGDVINTLEKLQPTGYGNPEPIFVSRDVPVKSSRTVGADAKHLRLVLTAGGVTFDAIGFRLGHLHPGLPAGTLVDLMYTFETNEYMGRSSLQLNLKDVKLAGEPDTI